MDERRQLPRWQVKKEVNVWLPQSQGFIHCILEDLHLKGMCVSFNKKLPTEDPLRISFTIEDNYDFIKIEALVPWTKEEQGRFFYGLSFRKINDVDKDRIYNFISTNCLDQFKDKWWA